MLKPTVKTPARLAFMLASASTVIIESSTNWPAIVASISTGVAAVAGIGGTLWQASRNWSHDDKKARVADKRRIYVSCLSIFGNCMRAQVSYLVNKGSNDEHAANKTHEYNDALVACLAAFYELTLVAPNDVIQLSGKVFNDLNNREGSLEDHTVGEELSLLMKEMRADLGEPPILGGAAVAESTSNQPS